MLKVFLSFCLSFILLSAVYAQKSQSFAVANQFFNNLEYDKAKNIYEKLYADDEYKMLVFENYVTSLIKLKAFDHAEKVIKNSLKNTKENIKPFILLGLLYTEKGNIIEADKIYNEIVRNIPKDNFKIGLIANEFYRINKYEFAVKTFLNGRKVLNDDNEFSVELVNLYRYMNIKDGLAVETVNLLATRPDFINIAKSYIVKAFDKDEDYQNLKSLLLKKIQKHPDDITLSELLIWTYTQVKEYNMAVIQAIALDKRSSGNGQNVYQLTNILQENKAYDYAQKAYNYLLEKGNNSPFYLYAKVEVIKIKQKSFDNKTLNKDDLIGLEKDYESLITEVGKNKKSLFAIIELAKLKATYLNKTSEAEQLLEECLNYQNLSLEDVALIKINLADIYLLNNNSWEASLVLGQIDKSLPNTPISQEAKFKSAKISFYNGDFKWAKAQLDVLKASTSQLIANDAMDLSLLINDNLIADSTGIVLKEYANAEFLITQNQLDKALNKLDSIINKYPTSDIIDDALISKAKIYKEKQQYQLAVNNYKNIVEKHPKSIWLDDALYNLGVLFEEQIKDNKKASSYFLQIIENYTGSLYINDARKRFLNLQKE